MKKYFVVVVLLSATVAFGQGAPINGTATVTLTTTTPTPVVGTTFTVDVNADLTNVTGTCNTTVPGVLDGYSLPISFNNTELQFVSAAACTSPDFSATPSFTAPANANAAGQVTIASSQTSQTSPTGNVCVARLTFQAVTASSSLSVLGTGTLSSAFQNCSGGGTAGPASIPYTGSALDLGPTGAVPTLSPLMLMVLAAALTGVALFSGVIKQ